MKTKKIVFGMAIFAFLLALVNYQQIKKNHDLSSLQISDQEMRDEIESESEIEMEESPKNPLGLAHERFMQRAGKDGKIPSNALVKAKNLQSQKPRNQSSLKLPKRCPPRKLVRSQKPSRQRLLRALNYLMIKRI